MHIDPTLLFKECWNVLNPHIKSGKMGPLYRAGFESSVKDGRLYTVRDDSGLLLAFMQISDKSRLACLSVDRIAVREGYQRRGLGSQLIAQAWQKAEEKSVPLRLRVANTNADGIAFYSHLGFKIVETSDLTSAMEAGSRLTPASASAERASTESVLARNTRKSKPRRAPGQDLPSSIVMYEDQPLTVDRIHNIPVAEREPIAQFLFRHFRTTGFPYPRYPEAELRKDFEALKATHVDIQDGVLSTGVTAGSKLFKHFFPHFFECSERGPKGTLKPSMLQQFEDDKVLMDVIRNRLGITFVYRGVSFPFNISGDMLRQGMRSMHMSPMTTNFRASVAKALYREYLPEGGIAYDYSIGFGQRMLGFLADGRGALYLGCDPWKQQVEAAEALRVFVGGESDTPLVDLHCTGSETFCPNTWQGLADLAFSSPPYFDVEVYDNGSTGQAYAQRSYEKFLSDYWTPTVRNTRDLLRPGGRMILNIVERYKADMLRICQREGLVLERELGMSMAKSHLSGKVGTNALTKTEPVSVLRKA